MAEDNGTAWPDEQTRDNPPRVDKAVVKEVLSDLLGRMPAFCELMSLP
jgi:hypothetical protein